jgi:hypothetical protein
MSDLNFEGLSEAQLRLFAVRCARRVQHLMIDPRSIAALDVAERHANGEATDDELTEAEDAARAAARDAAWYAASAAAWYAASAAAWYAARAEAWAAARAAASAVERAAELAEQQNILDEIRQEVPR